jgi:pimeloyl-ACP methyl ester carboxylesterase
LAIDYEGIAALQSFEDRSQELRETFLRPAIGGAHTVAVVSMPLRATPQMGWVICHAFALEHLHLQPFQASLARRLAGAGFAVLRFDAHGYGDSELGFEHMSLSSQVDDSRHAAAVLAAAADVGAIGFFGCRLGGTVATLAADREAAAGLIAVNAVVRGEPYIQAQLRRVSLPAQAAGATLEQSPFEELRSHGMVDMMGFPLRREVFEEISALDLVPEIQRFRGRSLVIQVSTLDSPDPDLERLRARLGALGGQVDAATIVDSGAHRLGLARWRRSTRDLKVDTQEALTEGIIEKTVAWCATDRWTAEVLP